MLQVRCMAAMGPVAYVGNAKGPLARLASKAGFMEVGGAPWVEVRGS